MNLFPEVKQVLIQETETITIKTGEVIKTLGYALTSIPPEKVTLKELATHMRKHWSIENSLHYVKDTTWREDSHMLRRSGVGEVFALLVSRAIGFLQHCDIFGKQCPLSQRAKRFSFNPQLALNLLT